MPTTDHLPERQQGEPSVQFAVGATVFLKPVAMPLRQPEGEPWCCHMLVTPWHDGLIEPCMLWEEEIKDNLERMDVFVGLLTTGFLASGFIQTVELRAARQKGQKEGRDFLFVLILVDDISLAGLNLSVYQIMQPGGKPVSRHSSRKAGFNQAQKELEELIRKRRPKK